MTNPGRIGPRTAPWIALAAGLATTLTACNRPQLADRPEPARTADTVAAARPGDGPLVEGREGRL